MANLLQKYEETFPEIIKSGLTDSEKLSIIWKWFELKAFNMKLNNTLNKINSKKELEFQEEQKQLFIESLQQIGYICDGRIEDYELLFNRSEIFGENWKAQAKYYFDQSAGIDYFINLVKEKL